MNIKISIILPTYNGAQFIKMAINSVIYQSFLEWELLIIDDGSNDNTEEVVNEYLSKDNRIIYIKNEVNLGIQKSLNFGLKKSKGKYIARIDDDDKWIDKDKLQKQFDFLENNRDYVLIGTGVVVVDENGKELFRYLLPETDKVIRSKILGKNCFAHSSVLFKKDISLEFGGYSEDENSKHIEDYDLWLKLGTTGKFYNIDSYSISFMSRVGSLTSKNRISQAVRSSHLIINYRKKYPNFLINYLLSILRLFFFYMQKILLFNSKSIYKIQAYYKSI